jgi:hypothetical protein
MNAFDQLRKERAERQAHDNKVLAVLLQRNTLFFELLALERAALELCALVEKVPASVEATNCSIAASKLHSDVQKLRSTLHG